MAKFLTRDSGLKLRTPITTSTGVSDANKIVQTTSSGKFDPSLMPAGSGPDVKNVEFSEAAVANDLINIWNDGGTEKGRLADAANGRPAHGYVTTSVSIGGFENVYKDGMMTGLSGKTPGTVQYLSVSTPGKMQETEPSTSTQLIQPVGYADSVTEVSFEYEEHVTIE